MQTLIERHRNEISCQLSCFDRVVVQGTLKSLCYSKAMTAYLKTHHIRIFDYSKFAEPFREQIRTNAEKLAQDAGIEVEFIRKSKFRKEAKIKKILEERGHAPGLVHILSAMESCSSYLPWHDKNTHETFLKPTTGKCLHYYFYFIDEEYGLCYLRVPTWCPFRLQFYCNGHNWLARKLDKAGIDYKMLDNAFVSCEDFTAAQKVVDKFSVKRLHLALERFARRYCPAVKQLGMQYHWSIMQIEYATDIIFRRQQDLSPLYENLCRTAIHTVKPEHIATFLGRKLTGNYRDELGNDFSTRIEGTRIRHHMGTASIKMYDKFGLVLRIETTANDVSFFKHYRTVEHRDGSTSSKLASVKKTIYSIGVLQEILSSANRRYLEFISALDDDSPAGNKSLTKVSAPKVENERNYKGFNFFSPDDTRLFETIVRGEYNIYGMRNADLRSHMPELSQGQVSRLLKRLRVHGIIKRIGRTYKYYLTNLGKRTVVAGFKLKHLFLVPSLAKG